MTDQKGPKLIRSMMKGLDCLVAVNRHNGLSIAECGTLTGLPRTTAFRVLETLAHAGYICRDGDGIYRTTSLVRTLGGDYEGEEWVRDIGIPEIGELGDRLSWSVGIATPHDLMMTIRTTTDASNPLSLDRFSSGARLPMAQSSPGQVYLAYLPSAVRARMLDALEEDGRQGGAKPFGSRQLFEHQLDRIAARGYAQNSVTPKEHTISVPIMAGDKVIGGCGMKYIARAVSQQELFDRLLPELRATAKRIASRLAATETGETPH